MTSTSAGANDSAEVNVEAVSEHEGLALGHARGDLGRIDIA